MSHSSQRASETSTCSATLTPASSKASSRAARASVRLVSGARGGKNPSHSEHFRTHRRRLSQLQPQSCSASRMCQRRSRASGRAARGADVRCTPPAPTPHMPIADRSACARAVCAQLQRPCRRRRSSSTRPRSSAPTSSSRARPRTRAMRPAPRSARVALRPRRAHRRHAPPARCPCSRAR